jgi:hypothetical protein
MSASIGGLVGFILVNSDVPVIGGEGDDGITITLTNLNGSAVTDASGGVVAAYVTEQYGPYFSGRFAFSNIPDGEYALELPANFTLAASTDGRDIVTIDATSANEFAIVDINASLAQPTATFGVIEGDIYDDSNQNGVRDNGETAAAGQLIELENSGGTVVDVTTAAANGSFSFGDLVAGDYTLATPGIDISQAPSGGTIDLGVSETFTGATIGVYQLSVSGFAFNDANGDDVQNNGEGAFAGQTIELLDSAGTVVASGTTNAEGDFTLDGLTAGTYTFSAAGGGVDAGTGGQTITVGTTSLNNVTVAAYAAATISGLLFLDENNDGLFEVTPQGTDPDLGTGGLEIEFLTSTGFVAGTAVSGFGGLFTASPLAPGTYTIAAAPGDGLASGPASLHTLTVTEGETLSSAVIGIYEPNSIVVPSIFIDSNFDGNDDGAIDNLTASSAEPVTVALLNEAGSIATDIYGNLDVVTLTSGVLQETTTQYGPYTVTTPAVTFNNLAPGYYSVEVSAPGYQAEESVAQVGAALETTGLPEEPTTAVQPIALYQIGTGLTITGAVTASMAGGGQQGIADDTVSLLENIGGTLQVEQTVDTNAAGQYSFSGIGAGHSFEIDFGTPLGYSATTPVFNVAVAGTGTAGTVAGPSAHFTLSSTTVASALTAATTLNLILIGQSNAAYFTESGYLTLLEESIEQDLGFNGTSQVVNIIAAGGPADSGSTDISSAPATEFGGTALTTDWLTANNGNEADGWTSGTNEDGVYSQMNAVLTYLAQTFAADPAMSSEPTAIIDLHNETDVQNPLLNTSIWMSALSFEASAIRAVLGETPAQAPYAFVNAIPFPEEPIAVATQAQVDENEQAIRLGMESLASNPAFDGIIAAQINDIDQNYQADGDGGWHLNGASTTNRAGQVVGVATNASTGEVYDDYVLEQRLALSLADAFSASALPGSPVAQAVASTGTLFDDTGPLVTGAATVAGHADELLLTVQQFDSATSFNTALSADALAGVGWSLRTSASGADSQLVATGTSATIISATEVLVTFDAAVPAAASGDLLFYAWGGERIAPAGTPSSALSSNYSGTTYPGEGAAIYDSNGEPIYTNAAGVLIGSSQETIASYLSVALGQTVSTPTITTGTLELGVGSSLSGPISFSGTGGELRLDSTPPLDIITGFQAGDTVVLSGVPYVAGLDSYTVANAGTLIVDADGTPYTLDIAGATVGETNFVLGSDLMITETSPACFAAGTRLLARDGEIAVEAIVPGDVLVTVRPGGPAMSKVVWTGSRTYNVRRRRQPALVCPVRITAGAFGRGVPERDLRLSPEHAVYLDGTLVPAMCLVNGKTIFQEMDCAFVTYHHVELAAHDVVLAEGLPCESYLDTGNREMFQVTSALPARAARPGDDATRLQAALCAPLGRERAASPNPDGERMNAA